MKNSFSLLSVSATIVLVLVGCNRPASESTQIASTPSAAQSTAAGIIPAEDIDLVFAVVSGPTYDAVTDTVTYQIEATNNGGTVLSSEGEHPVNVGVVIRDADGNMVNPPANQDYLRVALPQPLSRSQAAKLGISFQVEPTLGGVVVVDAVQESVSWFSGYGKPVLTLGSFERCDSTEGTMCMADGTVISPSR